VAAEVAYMIDVEARPLRTDEFGLGSLDYLGTKVPGGIAALTVNRALGTERAKTVLRWRDDGRRALAALGAWPWTEVPNGRLPRSWRRDPRFVQALRVWSGLDDEALLALLTPPPVGAPAVGPLPASARLPYVREGILKLDDGPSALTVAEALDSPLAQPLPLRERLRAMPPRSTR